jgi:RNA polymerase sigma factor (sigma-70 family)
MSKPHQTTAPRSAGAGQGGATNLRGPATEGPTDRELLEQFVRRHDEASFEHLLYRHGPMVLRVCRRVLGHVQDAEDAFQATFLVLMRKAHTLGNPELLSNWLYGVASRIARKAQAQARRRRQVEQAATLTQPADFLLEVCWREIRALLVCELQHLPLRFRAPLALCYLEGLTNEEAARRLGWPTGSISYRLACGRCLLRARLASRHSAALGLETVLPERGVPAPTHALDGIDLPCRARTLDTPEEHIRL